MSPPIRRAAPALLLLLAAACTEPAKPARVLDERHVITVDGTTVRYNGQLLDWNGTVKDWEKVLGPATRVVRAISVWDDLGVFLYHDDVKPTPAAFEVLLGRTRHSQATEGAPDFWPREPFRGRLVVDGALIHGRSTIREIDRQKKGAQFQRSYLPTIYDYDLDGFYIRLDFGHDGTLTSFSISPSIFGKPAGTQGVQQPGEGKKK
ncbi:DUF7738 domain-containing protein [Anaeromyxobacter oryzisoli]|uniref:DUF7738 domain-containing protein n=1 Tax=Anaeromyxobacter oryzisoli TaxID=2925408 RepID=UPI001F56A1E3|nr:hypothetical protein [Anaeromyxobacter sp. SG63]